MGYAGEFVSEEYAKSQELECNGLPVYLSDNKPYYPLFNVPEIADNYEKPTIYTNIDRNIIKDIDKYLIKDIDSSVNRYISTIVESLLCSYLDLETSTDYKAYEAEKLLDDSKSMYLERAILVYERMKDDYGIK